jgi:hypothetical protein
MSSRIMSMPTSSSSCKFNNSNNDPSNLMLSSMSSNSSNSSNANYCLNEDTITATSKNIFSTINQQALGLVNHSNIKWNIGLMNNEGKYLTAENFGFKINATGNTLRKKQKWQIEQDIDEHVYLISPLGFYLSTDKYGKLSCEKIRPDIDSKFYLETNNDGKWSFKSVAHGYYFGGSGDRLHCFSKMPEMWTIHLAIHPQVVEKLIINSFVFQLHKLILENKNILNKIFN